MVMAAGPLGQVIKAHSRGQYHWAKLKELFKEEWDRLTEAGRGVPVG
jgi:hypothetical protein